MMSQLLRKVRTPEQTAVRVGKACAVLAAVMMGSSAQQMEKLALHPMLTRDSDSLTGAKITITCATHYRSKSVCHSASCGLCASHENRNHTCKQ